ncbi:aspartyl protease family protein [Longimicrobium sp.]|uniref:aspartyl protease family protein n=1 Tax=Longimicrobium sp. TaxID=2029185 RepID=UPI002E37984E|nr:aspartyl protease family protein [Longimicrobium sp.]HEX6037382.1 aspartyl protease family protein [Longimicrobium sp.]
MIVGVVNDSFEATVELTVCGPGGQEERLEFVVDTGFAGTISLHPAVAAALGLPYVGQVTARLADGSLVPMTIRAAQLLWNGGVRDVSVDIAENVSMIGMNLLAGHEFYMRTVPGGEVLTSAPSDFVQAPHPG